MLSAVTPTLFISSSSICVMTASPNSNLPMLDNFTLDQPECPPAIQANDDDSIPSKAHSRSSKAHSRSSEGQAKPDQDGSNSRTSPVRSAAFNRMQNPGPDQNPSSRSASSDVSRTTTDTKSKLELILKGPSGLQQQVNATKQTGNPATSPSGSGCVKSFPPSPSKTA